MISGREVSWAASMWTRREVCWIAALSAVLHARATGEGQLVDVAQQDSVVTLTEHRALGVWSDGRLLSDAGILFVANAAFNNLGRPLYSTAFNWARATLGTIPFAYLGAHFGPTGVLIGPAVGAVIFGSLALWVAFRLSAKLANAR